jgi:hypothetical protein
MSKNYKILSCLLCDFAVKGQGHKDILIGIYANVMVVSTLPAMMPLAVWVQLQPVGLKDVKMKIEIIDPHNKSIARIEGELILNENNIVGLPFQIPIVKFVEEGKYKIELEINSSKETIKEFSVIKMKDEEDQFMKV